MLLPRRLVSRTFAVIAFSVIIYAAVAVFVGWEEIRGQLATFPATWLVPLTLLSLLNYGLRFRRWNLYLKALDLRLPLRDSVGLYFATYLMVITPGKIGEVFKAGILHERYGASLARALPIVLAERIADFLAVLVLAAIGLVFWPGALTGLATGLVAAACVPLALAVFQWRPVRSRLVARVAASPLLGRHALAVDEAADTLGHLIGPRLGAMGLVLSTVAWGAECVGLWLVTVGLGAGIALGEAVFVYAAGTVVGSLSFLPGGLGGTEATMIWLLEGIGMTRAAAGSATVLVRLFTLWLAVAIGLGFFLAFRHLFTTETPDAADSAPPGERPD